MVDAPKGRLLPLLGPDRNTPRDVHLVGRYALGVEWQDGHSSIYPFDYLRTECPCAECQERAAGASPLPEAQAWPIEINKAGSGLRVRWQDDHVTAFEGARLRGLCRCAACAAQSR